MLPDKVATIMNSKAPTNETSSFLGYANFYRRFVDQFVAIASPLYKLIHGMRDVKLLLNN